MSKKFEICSATYNIALNQNTNDVFGTGCAHLYHFLQGNCNYGKSEVYKPMMLKMHLELNELIEETEEQIVEPSNSNNPKRPLIQQLEAKFQSLEDSLQANNVDAINKIIERMEKLEKNFTNNFINKATDVGNNTIDHESKNALLRISDNTPRLSAQQLEANLKTSEDSPQANIVDAVNKLIERMDKMFEKNLSNNIVDKTPDVGNNTIDHESNNALLSISDNAARQSVQQLEKEVKDRIEQLEHNKSVNETADIGNPTTYDNSTDKQQHQITKHNSSQEPLNNGNNGSDDHSDGKEYQTIPKEKKEIHFDKDNLVTIWRINSSDSSLETAFHNVIKYAKEMDLSLTRDQIKHIDVRIWNFTSLIYYVFFRTRTIKDAFLMKRDILKHYPHQLIVQNESEFHSVFIRNFEYLDAREDITIPKVIRLAKQMGLTLMRDQIRYIDVFKVNETCMVYRVYFSTTQLKDEFLKKSLISKELSEINSFEIY